MEASTATLPGSYYEDDYIDPTTPIRHLFTRPNPATPEETTEAVVNREALEAAMEHFCQCSRSTRYPQKPSVTPVRDSGYNRGYLEDLRRQRPIVLDSPSRWTEENLPNEYLSEGRYLSGGQWNLDMTMGAPIASSSRLDHDRTCHVHKLGMYWDINDVTDNDVTDNDVIDPSDEEEDDYGTYDYRFVPRERTIEFEKSIIAWV